MESFSKVRLDEQQQSLLTAVAFGTDAVIISSRELTGGFFNTAYDLELSDGRSVILKVAPALETEILSYEKDIMRAEVEALRLVRAAGGIPVPEVYFYDESCALIACPYFFMEKIEGRPYSDVKDSLSADQQFSIEYELGRYQRQINEITGPAFGLFAEASASAGQPWRDVFRSMLQNVLQDALRLGAPLPASLPEIELVLEHCLPALDEVTEPRLIHWDLWNGNLFVQDGVIVSIIDWERALWGDVLMENYFRHFENSQAFYEGYGTKFDSPDELLRIKLYDLYLDLIMVVECYPRQYTDENHMRWVKDNLSETWRQLSAITHS
ncbi:aminoglycoside phosphotransferase family protein [Paenibacillus sp. MMS20-IR301]|uniref:phosphotransferase family protein n=1 Tax=Paenibacillus sp. MMS20-IR301 TaxID=2895946 RepID=UPI0028EF2902|nr:aminoglycoside phosphotransferase family protein [Paenibacillus sp. MMS20-IR301]WNS45639.1 aminoglycoside phosphotransferase family protein [Paenibacillus sp. MMS20-IR301]